MGCVIIAILNVLTICRIFDRQRKPTILIRYGVELLKACRSYADDKAWFLQERARYHWTSRLQLAHPLGYVYPYYRRT